MSTLVQTYRVVGAKTAQTKGDKGVPNETCSMSKSLGEADDSTQSDGKDSSVECPTCGKDDFDTTQGMKIHHTVCHGESIAGEIYHCDMCGSECRKFKSQLDKHERNFCSDECQRQFVSEINSKRPEDRATQIVECKNCSEMVEKQNCRIERYDNVFCSTQCQNEWQSDNMSGADSPLYKRKHTECDECGSGMEVQPHRLKNRYNNFCSRECYSRYRSQNYVRGDNPRWQGGSVDVECSICKSEFTVERSHYNAVERHVCSKGCMSELLSNDFRGENHPLWKGGHDPYYGPDWDSIRDKVRDRDGYACQICGVDEKDLHRGLDVHHIIPKRKFDNVEESNRLNNLISLCNSCHKRWEGIPLKPQVR